MKKIRVFPWLLAFVLIFGFSGTAFTGGGGPEDPACSADPFPDASQCDKTEVKGTITVARAAPCAVPVEPDTYSVHIVLKGEKNVDCDDDGYDYYYDHDGDDDYCYDDDGDDKYKKGKTKYDDHDKRGKTKYDDHDKRGRTKEVHLFSFSTPLGAGDLCALEEDDFLDLFFRVPCSLGVQDVYGFDGIAVIKKLKIVNKENCGTPAEMIRLKAVVCDAPAPPLPIE